MTVTKQDVLYALLALDAYNRHEDPDKRKMSEKGDVELSAQIGTVAFVASSDRMEETKDELAGSQTSGFSASHYTQGDQKIISYRGTDFPNSWIDFEQVAEFLKDFGTGWLTSINSLSPDSVNDPIFGIELIKNQPYYARTFYELVTETKIFPNGTPLGITMELR